MGGGGGGASTDMQADSGEYFLRYSTSCSAYLFYLYSINRDNLPESTYKYQLLGLNLLCLLSQNRLAEFHTVSILYR